MKNKISGEELLLAIGELPEKLLDYKSKALSKKIIFKKLSVAACFIICVSLSIQIAMLGIGGIKDMAPSMSGGAESSNGNSNFTPENSFGNSAGDSASDGESSEEISNEITIDLYGNIINPTVFDNNYLQIERYNDLIKITFEYDDSVSYTTKVYTKCTSDNTNKEILPENMENKFYKTYLIEVTENSIISFKNNSYTKDFEIHIEVFEDYYLYKIEKK